LQTTFQTNWEISFSHDANKCRGLMNLVGTTLKVSKSTMVFDCSFFTFSRQFVRFSFLCVNQTINP
jgi:hypothetical protein